jgi:hypothetical protein
MVRNLLGASMEHVKLKLHHLLPTASNHYIITPSSPAKGGEMRDNLYQKWHRENLA